MRITLTPCLLVVLAIAPISLSAQGSKSLTIDQVMTPQELKTAGIASLSLAQREALNEWLNRYTMSVLMEANKFTKAEKRSSQCDPAIESQIDGDFKGWEGETIYHLRNGQIWQQSSYHYHYHYAYAPEVTIYSSGPGCRMIVKDDDDEPISVRRLN